MQIWFHGTTKKNALKIRTEGFQVGTYFARHLEDALAFGGPYVFEVALDPAKIERGNDKDELWQLHSLESIPPTAIVAMTLFTNRVLFLNVDLKKHVLESNQDGSIDGFADKVDDLRHAE